MKMIKKYFLIFLVIVVIVATITNPSTDDFYEWSKRQIIGESALADVLSTFVKT